MLLAPFTVNVGSGETPTMELLSKRRFRAVSAQMVNCCVEKYQKQCSTCMANMVIVLDSF